MYRYDYYDKIGKFYHKSRAGNSFGATLHQALQGFHEAGGVEVESADVLAARATDAWRSYGFANSKEEDEYRHLAGELLLKYHSGAMARAGQTRLFLSEKTIKLDLNEFDLTGRVDRVDEHVADGTLEIIDYKSGRAAVTADDVENALAMCVYQLILKRSYPERRVMASIHALRSGEVATVELTADQLNRWENDIKEIGQRIIATDWESIEPNYLPDICPTCDFLKLCERRWRALERITNLD
jgi:putative RecB family exonuclease